MPNCRCRGGAAGSTTEALSMRDSDIDLYVYATEPVNLTARRDIAARSASRSEIGTMRGSRVTNGSMRRPATRSMSCTAPQAGSRINWIACSSGTKRRSATRRPFGTTCCTACRWSIPTAGIGISSRRLASPMARHEVAQSSRRMAAAAAGGLVLSEPDSIGADRGDIVSVQHRVTALLSSYFDIIFAVNELPHPGEKRLLQFLTDGRLKLPAGMSDQIDDLVWAEPGASGGVARRYPDRRPRHASRPGILFPVDARRPSQAKP